MASIPVLIYGEHSVAQGVARAINKLLGSEWCGMRRVHIIITSNLDTVCTAARRELICLFPPGTRTTKLPPVFNVRNADPQDMGLVALIGIMQTVLLPENTDQESQSIDWIYLLTDNLQLPGLLTTRLDNVQVTFKYNVTFNTLVVNFFELL